MDTTFCAMRRTYDNAMPPEDVRPDESEHVERAIEMLVKAGRAFDGFRWAEGDGHVEDARAELAKINTNRGY